jgi:hypothetical protein
LCRSEGIYGVNTKEELLSVMGSGGNTLFLVQSFHNLNTNRNAIKDVVIEQGAVAVYSNNSFKGIEFSVFKRH